MAPPLERFPWFLRHWYVSVGWPVAVTVKEACAPAQTITFVGSVTVIGIRSYAPMST